MAYFRSFKMAQSSQSKSPQTLQPCLSDTLLLGASLIGAPTGESISRVSLAGSDCSGDTSGISLVREMGQLTPCALLERAGVRRTRRNKIALTIGLVTSSSLLAWLVF